jgi:hypothetical protein
MHVAYREMAGIAVPAFPLLASHRVLSVDRRFILTGVTEARPHLIY